MSPGGPSPGDAALCRRLLLHAAARLLPDAGAVAGADVDVFARLFGWVAERSALLVAEWQSLGFCHGMLNTDNLALAGITLDYGPFGARRGAPRSGPLAVAKAGALGVPSARTPSPQAGSLGRVTSRSGRRPPGFLELYDPEFVAASSDRKVYEGGARAIEPHTMLLLFIISRESLHRRI